MCLPSSDSVPSVVTGTPRWLAGWGAGYWGSRKKQSFTRIGTLPFTPRLIEQLLDDLGRKPASRSWVTGDQHRVELVQERLALVLPHHLDQHLRVGAGRVVYRGLARDALQDAIGDLVRISKVAAAGRHLLAHRDDLRSEAL